MVQAKKSQVESARRRVRFASISGTFTNLPDGGSIIIGNNAYQANYQGGDGNDLTLTVVQ